VNKGSAAQVISTVETLRKFTYEPRFVLLSITPELDAEQCSIHNIAIVAMCRQTFSSKRAYLLWLFHLLEYVARCTLWSGLNKIGFNVKGLLAEKALRAYMSADVIVDLSGDSLSDQNCYSIFSLLSILIGILLRKRIVIFSQSIGRFYKATTPLARFCLNRANLVVVRENETLKYLKKIGVNNPQTYLAAEIAFLLKAAMPERVQEILLKEGINMNEKASPLVGIGPSALEYEALKSKKGSYIALMAKIADYLVEEKNTQVVMVPHLIIPPEYGLHDDRYMGRMIRQAAKNRNRINLIKGDYSPEELKGIIGACELFIGARMHSNIASTSMHVPTIALAWSHKYRGIMTMLEQEKYVCDIETATFEGLMSKINDALQNRTEIKKKLALKVADAERSAFQSSRLVAQLVESLTQANKG